MSSDRTLRRGELPLMFPAYVMNSSPLSQHFKAKFFLAYRFLANKVPLRRHHYLFECPFNTELAYLCSSIPLSELLLLQAAESPEANRNPDHGQCT